LGLGWIYSLLSDLFLEDIVVMKGTRDLTEKVTVLDSAEEGGSERWS
jgi:hypothetical protein